MMKPVLTAMIVFGWICSGSSGAESKDAAKSADKAADGGKNPARAYDKDANGQINGSEVMAVKDAFKGGAKLGSYDTNHDGELSDAEIAKIRTGSADARQVQPGKVFIQPKRKRGRHR